MNDYLEVRDYWSLLARRYKAFFLTLLAVFGASIALAYLLPATYRSEATILIERQTIPKNLVATTVTVYVQEQIEHIRQRISIPKTLISIAKEQGVTTAANISQTELFDHMIDHIEVDMVDIKTMDPDKGGERLATIAFTVAFTDRSPDVAQFVTAELAKQFLSEHKLARERSAAEVSRFLQAEANELRTELQTLESSLAEFKQGRLLEMPELMDMNFKLFEKTENDIVTSQNQIRMLDDNVNALRSELSLTPLYSEMQSEAGERILSSADRLSVLTAEYLRATSRYSARHPDVRRLAREIRVLASQSGSAARADELMEQLVRLQEELRQARQQYNSGHPTVTALERSVANMQRGLVAAVAGNASSSRIANVVKPDNPRYVALQTQISSTESNLRAERTRLTSLRDKLAEYEQRLMVTPQVEKEYKSISIDYDNTSNKYQEIKEKQRQARLAQQLEAGVNAERFTIVGRAFLPRSPDSPNRLGIMLIGSLLAVIFGIGAVAMAEHLDRTIRGIKSVKKVLGIAPIAVIPNLVPVKMNSEPYQGFARNSSKHN